MLFTTRPAVGGTQDAKVAKGVFVSEMEKGVSMKRLFVIIGVAIGLFLFALPGYASMTGIMATTGLTGPQMETNGGDPPLLLARNFTDLNSDLEAGFDGSNLLLYIPALISALKNPAAINLTADPTEILADGTSTSAIEADVTKPNGQSVEDGTEVTFSTDAGTVSPSTTPTNNGMAWATLTSSTVDETATVTAWAGSISQTADVEFKKAVTSITLITNPTNIPADGTTWSMITATLIDAFDQPVAKGTELTFETTSGTFSNGAQTHTVTTADNSGTMADFLRGAIADTATITVASGTETSNEAYVVIFSAGPFAMTLQAVPSSLLADGTSISAIRATVADGGGSAVTDGTIVSFNVITGTGILSAPTATTTGGIATVTYTASITPGTETIRADTANSVFNTVDIILTGPTVGSVTVTPGSPSIIADGDSNTLIFAHVRDTGGSNIPDGTTVTFITTAGSLSEETTTVDGIATAKLTSSTNLGSATIWASSGGISDTTTVSFVPGPVADISLTATPATLEADGIQTSEIRAYVTDLNGHSIDNETITFAVTTGTGLLSAPIAITSGGVAQVTYTASTTAGIETITAASTNGTSSTVNVALQPSLNGGVLSIGALPTTIPADGVATSDVTATLTYNDGSPIAGIPVTFSKRIIALPFGNTYAGTGTTVTTPFHVESSIITFTMDHDGESNFIVWLWEETEGRIALLANEIGEVPELETLEDLDTGNYFLEIKADGNWHVKVEGNVGPIPDEILATVSTDASGEAPYTYTSTTIKGQFNIYAVCGYLSDYVTVTQTAGDPAHVEISVVSDKVYANGSNAATILATVTDTNNNPVEDGTTVTFSATVGTIDLAADTINGTASANLTSVSSAVLVVSTVIATANGHSDTATVEFLGVSLDNMSADPTAIYANGSDKSVISVRVSDEYGVAVSAEAITFNATLGTLTVGTVQTNVQGNATTELIAPTTTGTATVAAEYGLLTSSVDININAPKVGTVTITSGDSTLIADDVSNTLIFVHVWATGGSNMPNGTVVTFTTTAGSLSEVTTTVDGIATAKLTSSTNRGTATVRATSGGISGTTAVIFIAGQPEQVTVTANPTNLTADGTSTSTIGITVLDANDNPVEDGNMLTLSAAAGTLDNLTATTIDGVAIVTYTAPNCVPGGGQDTITVETTNSKPGFVLITLVGPEIATITLSANPTSLPADGTSTATISATLTVVEGGDPPDGTTVNFSITQGGGNITLAATTGNGVASATLTSGSTVGTATIEAEAGGVTAQLQVEYTPGSVMLTIVPNSVLGTGDQTATVTVTLKNADGSPPVNNETVNFILSDVSLGQIPSSVLVLGGEGEGEVTFEAAAKGGTATIIATWETGGIEVTGEVTITIQSPPAFLEIVEGFPDPQKINIKGTGGKSTSEIRFNVKDSEGNLVDAGYRIDFSMVTGPNGGENLIPKSTKTENGQVTTLLYSGLKSGPVSIRATYHRDTTISTTASQIVIVGGPPVGEEFGISANYVNISGLSVALLWDPVTINAADRYGNAIPDNTAIAFKTYNTGGFFDTGTATTTNGVATDNLISGGTALSPINGFLSITGEVAGGKSTHVSAIEVVPSPDNHIVYAGTNGGGVYKSMDAGATWENISRSTENPKAGQNWIDPYIKGHSAISVDPDDHNIVYVGTGYLGAGHLYRSKDGGMNWNSNNLEEWNGLFSINAAVLTVLCDGDGRDYVWIGTEGKGAFFSADGEHFHVGGEVSPNPPTLETTPGFFDNPANTGDGIMTKPTLSDTSQTEEWTLTNVVPDASATVPVAGISNQGNGTMSNVTTDPSTTQTENWTVTYSASAGPVTLVGTGNGTVYNIQTKQPNVAQENWTLTCFDTTTPGAEVFRVFSTQAGPYPNATVEEDYDENTISFKVISGSTNYAVNDTFSFTTTADWQVSGTIAGIQTTNAPTGTPYTSDGGEVTFTINAATIPFAVEDGFSFSTTAAHSPYWWVFGTESGVQGNKASNGELYSSDNDEISFTITQGTIPFGEFDEFEFSVEESGLGHGRMVREIVKSPGTHGEDAVLYAATSTGVFRSEDGGKIWEEKSTFMDDNVNTLALHPLSDGTIDIIYAGTQNAGVWASTDSGNTWTQYYSDNPANPDSMGKGLSSSVPEPKVDNVGNGLLGAVTVAVNTLSEFWTVTCVDITDPATFEVEGSVSDAQSNPAEVGQPYTSDAGEVAFTISAGSVAFALNDSFTFTTTRDTGKTIKDLMVESVNDKLYALTYFFGPLEPYHAVGNVYAHELNANGSMGGGNWFEATKGLPEYAPPNDTTMFAQNAIAMDDPSDPNWFLIGGEGINMYKATSSNGGFDTGDPDWKMSKSGLNNLIMARMPVLFSGLCTMTVTEIITDPTNPNARLFRVYIEDGNGNPPVSGSSIEVWTYDYLGVILPALLNKTYPDRRTDEGTFTDPTDPRTNNPYEFEITVSPGSLTINEVVKVEFIFTPACTANVPGCSGSVQNRVFTY